MAKGRVGLNIANYRTLAGLTQEQLGERVGRILRGRPFTYSYISMIENGKRLVESRSLLAAFAEALGVAVLDLTGQPYDPTNRGDLLVFQVADSVRAALEDPEGNEPITLRPLDQLAAVAEEAMTARMLCDMPALGRHLPGLLAETRLLWFDQGDRTAGELFVKAAVTACLALKSAGWHDLAIRLAGLADQAARSHGDPVCVAAAQFAIAQCALTTGGRRRSARLAEAGVNDLDRLTRKGNLPPRLHNEVMSWMVMLHLHTALSKAAAHEGDPEDHLTAAAAIARKVTGNPWRMEPTPDNALVWKAGVSLELGEPDRVAEIVRAVDVNRLLTPQRKSRLFLEGGTAAHLTGDTTSAVRYLLLAENAAPGDLRQRSHTVEIVAHLVRQARDRGSAELRDLAVRVGIDPDSSDPV